MLDPTEYITQKFSRIMLDPSLFLDATRRPYEELEGTIYIPRSCLELSDDKFYELASFYRPYISRERILLDYATYRRYRERLSRITWTEFDGREFISRVPKELQGGYNALLQAEIPDSVRFILIDEFIFLATQSCLLSTFKKTFKVFEKLNVLPLINLERRVPPEWVGTVRGMKNCAKWIGFIAGLIMTLEDVEARDIIGTTIAGISLVIIDPPSY